VTNLFAAQKASPKLKFLVELLHRKRSDDVTTVI